MTKKILYINLPSSLGEQIKGLALDSSIPLPVEVPGGEENWDISLLEWPAIISGMLTVLAGDPRVSDGDYYRMLIKAVKPDIVPTVLTAAELKTDQGDFSFAEELFKSLCALEPDNPVHKTNLALFYQKKEDRQLQDNDQYAKSLEFLQKEKAPEGEAAILEFLKTNPESSNGWFLLGWALRQQKKWDKARDAFIQSSSLAPPTVALLNELSLCESESGRYDQAAEHLKEGLKLEEENTTLLSNLAMVYLRMNDLSKAEDIMNRLKEIDPDDPLAAQFFS